MFGHEYLGIIINIIYLSFGKILSENSSNSTTSWDGEKKKKEKERRKGEKKKKSWP